MKKRLLAMLLCLALIGSMLPVGVIAQEAEPVVETEVLREETDVQETQGQEETVTQVQEETLPNQADALLNAVSALRINPK